MKLPKSGKVLLNALPLVAIVIVGFMAWGKSQNQADAHVDYEQENPRYVNHRSGQSSLSQHLRAKRVIDGDTFELENGEMVRLCGIDAPETPKKDKQGRIIKPGQPFGEEARMKLQKFIEQANNDVILVEVERDRYHRIVGELFVRNTASRNSAEEFYVNGELVRAGLAYHYKRYSANCSGQTSFESSEEIARSEKLGVWSGNYQRPWDYRREQRGR